MLIPVEKVKERSKFSNYNNTEIERKLKKIEYAIRAYTHNKFLSKNIRFHADIEDNVILYDTDLIQANDTVLIDNTWGQELFTIAEKVENGLKIKENILDSQNDLIVKVVYPFDVIEGALDVLEWDFKMRNKVGVKSESLSRHSISYYDNDSNNTVNGYPVALFGFLTPYKKIRI